MKKILKAVLCMAVVLMVLIPFGQQVLATPETFSLTAQYTRDGKPLVGAHFDLYKIADMNVSAEFTPVEAFSGVCDIPSIQQSTDWRDAAYKLAEYADQNGIQYEERATTDENGVARFGQTIELEHALYLVVGRQLEYNGKYYNCAPFLVSMPEWNPTSEEWEYVVDASPKADWVAVTDIPPATPTSPAGPTTPADPKLPQTGMLWWPVPVLMATGLTLIVIGLVRKRGGNEE